MVNVYPSRSSGRRFLLRCQMAHAEERTAGHDCEVRKKFPSRGPVKERSHIFHLQCVHTPPNVLAIVRLIQKIAFEEERQKSKTKNAKPRTLKRRRVRHPPYIVPSDGSARE